MAAQTATTVTLARPGDGAALRPLLERALVPGSDDPSWFLRKIDTQGGLLPTTYGTAACLTARRGDEVVGMAYTRPPVRWLDLHPREQRGALAPLIVEVDLLAVDEAHEGTGVGTALVEAVRSNAASAGSTFVTAKVSRSDRRVQRWYRRRGFWLVPGGEAVAFRTELGTYSFDVGDDEPYLLAVLCAQPNVVLRRRQSHQGTYLTPCPV